ncbi:EAL domain-containing protein, partial [Acinetobacter baumannii]
MQNFAFDTVKLDRSFIADAALPNSRGGSIIRATVALARSLGMETTAEGIETVGQLDQVRAMGCTNGQGYYFAKPQPANMIPQLCPSRTAVA